MSSTLACCLCGVEIEYNAAAMCASCLAAEVDITTAIDREGEIFQCRTCKQYSTATSGWMPCEWESQQLLALCLRRIKGTKHLKVTDAKFVWTEPHSRRIRVRVTVQGEALDRITVQQQCTVVFKIRNQICPGCNRMTRNQTWRACVQVRQHVPHMRTIIFLEQLILRHNAHAAAIGVAPVKAGLDAFFDRKADAAAFLDFVKGALPVRVRASKKLISSNPHTNEYNHKFTYLAEVVPLCKFDLVALPPRARAAYATLGPLALCVRVASTVHLADPCTGAALDIPADRLFRTPVDAVAHPEQLQDFIVLDVRPLDEQPAAVRAAAKAAKAADEEAAAAEAAATAAAVDRGDTAEADPDSAAARQQAAEAAVAAEAATAAAVAAARRRRPRGRKARGRAAADEAAVSAALLAKARAREAAAVGDPAAAAAAAAALDAAKVGAAAGNRQTSTGGAGRDGVSDGDGDGNGATRGRRRKGGWVDDGASVRSGMTARSAASARSHATHTSQASSRSGATHATRAGKTPSWRVAEVEVARVADFGHTATVFTVMSHLADHIAVGDTVQGYFLSAHPTAHVPTGDVIPAVVLVRRKAEKAAKKRRRRFRLRVAAANARRQAEADEALAVEEEARGMAADAEAAAEGESEARAAVGGGPGGDGDDGRVAAARLAAGNAVPVQGGADKDAAAEATQVLVAAGGMAARRARDEASRRAIGSARRVQGYDDADMTAFLRELALDPDMQAQLDLETETASVATSSF